MTVTVNESEAEAPLGSVAVTVIECEPTSAATGVPVMTPAASIAIDAGSPVALNVSASPSGSEKLLATLTFIESPSVTV